MVVTSHEKRHLFCEGTPFSGVDAVVYRRPLYYDPTPGRLTTLDPFGGDISDPQSLHKYVYCHGDGINYADPTGRFEGLVGMLGAMNIRTSLSNLEADVGNQVIQSLESGKYAWDVVAWNVGIYVGLPFLGAVFSGLWKALPKIPGVVRAAEVIGQGGEKVIHAVAGFTDRVIAVLKPGKQFTRLEDEVGMLIALEKRGLPVPKIFGVTEVAGQAAYVMERFQVGSKELLSQGIKGPLNARSIEDLKAIRKIMVGTQTDVRDLQFLIGADGRVVIADPGDLRLGQATSDKALKAIDDLIKLASS